LSRRNREATAVRITSLLRKLLGIKHLFVEGAAAEGRAGDRRPAVVAHASMLGVRTTTERL